MKQKLHSCVHVYRSADRDKDSIQDRLLYFSSVSMEDYICACYRSMECGKKNAIYI